MVPIKRVAAVNDISCFGKCSLTVALPVLSACGLEAVPLPTALLSAHTGIPGYNFFDLTEQFGIIAERLTGLTKFDCIYSGFLGSERQIDIVEKFIDGNPGALIIVDPVMADNGRIYETYNRDMCKKMKSLVKRADVITPNVTEAAILLDEDYSVTDRTDDEMRSWAVRLLSLGTGAAVITGHRGNGVITSYAADGTGNEFEYSVSALPISISGTGDLFCSIFTAVYLNSDSDLHRSLSDSCDFVYKCLEDTLKSGRSADEGIVFEGRFGRIV